MDLPPQAVMQLKMFVSLVKANPEILHNPSLGFFKEFIESFGGTVPPPSEETKTKFSKKEEPAKGPEKEPEAASEPESEESEVELDNSGVIETPDEVPTPLADYNCDLEVSEDDMEKFDQKKGEGIRAYQEGNFEEAYECYSKAIEANPNIAAAYAKRGQCCLKMNRPNACIRDCDRALVINPNYAAAYKYRGRANRLLGNWEEAAKDLRNACKIDFDEEADEWLREVTPNARKLEEHRRKYERKKAEKELKERSERISRAREEHAKAAAASKQQQKASAGGEPDPSNFASFLNDPDMSDLMDPEVIKAFEDIYSNPVNIMKYQDNPKILAVIEKLEKKYGGGGGMGGLGGLGGAFNPFTNRQPPPPPPPSSGSKTSTGDMELD